MASRVHIGWTNASAALLAARFERRLTMLYYALVFLVIALVAGLLGFFGLAAAAAGIAKIIFFIFLVMFVVSLIGHMTRRV